MTREPAREYRATWLVRVYEHEQAGWTWNLLYDGRLLNACSGYTTEAEAMRSGERALARSVGQEERSTSAWRPANNGTGKRIWFVYRDAPDVSSRYHEDSRVLPDSVCDARAGGESGRAAERAPGRPMSRDARCTYGGKAYVIPEIWLAGFTSANRCTIADAVAYWAWQDELAESEEQPAAN